MPRYIVGFSQRNHIYAKGIQWFTQSPASHCYVREVHSHISYVLDSADYGCQVHTHDFWLRRGHLVLAEYYVVGDEAELAQAWDEICRLRVGRSYGWGQIVGDAVAISYGWATGKRIKNPFGLPWTDVCSETQHAWLLEAGLPGFEDLDPELVTPEDVWKIAREGHPNLTERKLFRFSY